jgi:hypothetical protein
VSDGTLGGGIHVGHVLKASEANIASGIDVDIAPITDDVSGIDVDIAPVAGDVNVASVHVTSRLPRKRFCLEIFGGSCRLTREFDRFGPDALGIDWHHNLDEAEERRIAGK